MQRFPSDGRSEKNPIEAVQFFAQELRSVLE